MTLPGEARSAEDPGQGTASSERSSSGRGLRAWLDRPAGRPLALALGLAILAAPAWLMADALNNFELQPTDFISIEQARDAQALARHLFEPLNTHVVPLFRAWTYALVCMAGRLERLPWVLLVSSYLSLVLAMVLVALLVRLETGRPALALGAMAYLGLSTVIHPTVAHFAAGQAIWTGVAIVATLLAARAWRVNGGAWRLGLTIFGVLASPAVWSGGLAAGAAVAAALWVDGRPRCRRAALASLGLTIAAGLSIVALSRLYIQKDVIIWEHHPELWPRPIQGVLHACQAIVEVLLLNNLGLDALTTELQSVVLVPVVAGLWWVSRRRTGRATPLEAAGAATVISSALLIYFFRGNLPFSSVRPVTWYHVIPQIGAVLLGAGWWAGLAGPAPSDGGRLTRAELLAVLVLGLVLSSVHAERAQRLVIEAAPPFTPSEIKSLPIPELKYHRALCLLSEHAARQQAMLARLDLVERIATRRGIGKFAIRRTFGRVLVPGIPVPQTTCDAASLLRLPEGDPNLDPAAVRSALGALYRYDPEPRPPWIMRSDPWPTRPGDSR